jgi:hypothetical protein
MLNRSGESGHSCLIPEFWGNGFRLFLMKYDVGNRFVLCSLYKVKVHSFSS